MFQDILIQLSTTKVKIINMENALIRLALLEIVNIVNNPSEIMFVSNKKNLFVTFKTIAKWTSENPVTRQILEWMLHG